MEHSSTLTIENPASITFVAFEQIIPKLSVGQHFTAFCEPKS